MERIIIDMNGNRIEKAVRNVSDEQVLYAVNKLYKHPEMIKPMKRVVAKNKLSRLLNRLCYILKEIKFAFSSDFPSITERHSI